MTDTKPHPLDAHARAHVKYFGGDWDTLDEYYRQEARDCVAAVLRVELTRKPTTDELNEAMREITWATELSDNAGLRCTVNAALKAAMTARFKYLGLA